MKPLNRRAFLRSLVGGTAAALPLPLLECMLGPHGEALANGLDLPNRFGLWFWGNGVRPDQWVPPTQGEGWTPSAELEPLAGFRDRLHVISGCDIKTATHPHHSGMAGILTGKHYLQLGFVRDTIVSTFDAPSVDQIAADWYQGETRFRSLEVGVTWFRGTDEGTTFQHLSHNGPNNPNPSEYDPLRVYERLFSIPAGGASEILRRSVLDGAHWRGSRLQQQLGATDRARMEQYLESVRALEGQLASAPPDITPDPPESSYPDVGGLEQIEQKNAAMSRLVALGLQTDQFRSFSVQFSTCGSGVVMWPVGIEGSLHALCHEEAPPQPYVHAATVFTMEQLAGFLQALDDVPEGNGTLLDGCSVLCTSELANGWNHSNQDFPLLIAGGGCGRLSRGRHWRAGGDDNASRAVLTALRGAGVNVPSFGEGAGLTTEVIGELLT